MALPQAPEAWARLGTRIRDERERYGLSRKVLAEMAGVSPASVQSAEKGAVPKGRWPQSLSPIERSLGWAPGSMKKVLDGGEPEYLLVSNLTPAAAGAPEWFQPDQNGVMRTEGLAPKWFEWDRDGSIQTEEDVSENDSPPKPQLLPREVEEMLQVVQFFGSTCVAHGAPEWLGAAYENAVAALLNSLSEPPQSQHASSRGHVSRERPGYSTKNPGYRSTRSGLYSDSLTRTLRGRTGLYDEIAKLSRQSGSLQASLRKVSAQPGLGRIAAASAASRAMEQVIRQNAEYRRVLDSLSTPARHAAALDLYNRLKPIAEATDTDEGDTPEDSTS